ncbi:hypothetical protein MGL_2808 [Malassezia globosa CBS 7966]|uniref:Uncharacterized protein n=1 Tax=Malassezia globosa (strain ATCC MYA-4612 / CBS 7966) TaxID=425265 RepID=A8Q5R5_MALGO|nr:uncharacterized protein MGL_2808 [Malassezia globosa CBS 7966]EDP42608.1 hypothetical protein MGL_2808 [Malassezia globosa CBS 7966]
MQDEHMDVIASGDRHADAEHINRRILYNIPDELQESNGPKESEELPEAPTKQAPEPGAAPAMPTLEHGDSIRFDALHLEGGPITQLSTSRLMAFVAYSGAHAKGIEWINDTRCVIVFNSYERAVEGLRHLCYEAVEDALIPSESGSLDSESMLLRPRLVMAFPHKLYNTMEQQAAQEIPHLISKLEEERARLDDAAEPVPEIYRDMELEEAERRIFSQDHLRVRQLRQSLWLRFALQNHDTKSPRSASRSNWYKQHGRGAGKDIVTRLLDVGDASSSQPRGRSSRRERRELFDKGTTAESLKEEEDYTPLSLRDRISGRYDRDWNTDHDPNPYEGQQSRERSASPESHGGLRIRGRGSRRAQHSRMHGWNDDE